VGKRLGVSTLPELTNKNKSAGILLLNRTARTQCIDAGLAFDTHAMSHVAWSAGDNHKSCAETAEPIEMPLGM